LSLYRKIHEYWESVEGEQTWQYLDEKPWHLGGRIRAFWIVKLITEVQLSSPVILDAGCSEGYFIQLVKESGYETIGCDISINLLEKNYEIFGERNSLVQCDLTALPFRDRVFDLILCSETLEHIPDWVGAVHEILRVYSEYILYSIPSYESLFSRVATILGQIIVKRDIRIEEPGGHVSIIRLNRLLSIIGNDVMTDRIVASHAFFSFPSGYWPPINVGALLLRVFPQLERFFEMVDKSLDERLWKFLISFSGSIILLGKRRD